MSKSSSEQTTGLDKYLTRAVAIAAVIAIPAGLFGYFSSEHAKRVETAFALYKQFNAEPIQQHWRLLMQRWNSRAEDVDRLLREKKHEELLQLTMPLVNDEKGMIALDQVLAFFDEAAACVENGLCDHNATFAMLKERAAEFAGPYGDCITHVRERYQNHSYGTGLFQIRGMRKKFNFFEQF